MSKKIILNDGTEIENSHVLTAADSLFVYIRQPASMAEIFAKMNVPENTGRITAEANGETSVYEGYTDLRSIQKDERQICVGLWKA